MLKILAGEFRSRILHTPDNDSTRPYTGRARESVFGMLHEWFDGARVLDLFAGVGTVGLEAVSRGASRVMMVERDRRLYRMLKQNISELGCDDRAEAVLGDALGHSILARAPAPLDLLFCDPPYALMRDERSRGRIMAQLARARSFMAGRSFVVLRTPGGPKGAEYQIAGYRGPEAHQYRPDMWVLLYEPNAADTPPNPSHAPVDSVE